MASAAGVRGAPGLVGYSASKGASVLFGNALARELGAENIRVNTICPGWVDTSFNQPAIDRMGGRKVQDELVAREVPLKRQSQPREIADAIIAEYVEVGRKFKNLASYLMFNLSCPNIADGRYFFADRAHLEACLLTLGEACWSGRRAAESRRCCAWSPDSMASPGGEIEVDGKGSQ